MQLEVADHLVECLNHDVGKLLLKNPESQGLEVAVHNEHKVKAVGSPKIKGALTKMSVTIVLKKKPKKRASHGAFLPGQRRDGSSHN